MSDAFSAELSKAVWKARGTPAGLEDKSSSSLYDKYCQVLQQHTSQEAAQKFRDSARSVVEEISRSSFGSTKPVSVEEYCISFNGKEHKFPREQEVVLVGRLPTCDVKLTNANQLGVSRIAVMLYLSPDTAEVALVDPHCLFGWRMLARTSDVPLWESVGKNRHAVIFLPWEESVVLQLGASNLVLQPRRCIVCEDKLRSIKLGCGHFVLCSDCQGKIQQCPLCREKAQAQEKFEEVHSFGP